MASQARRYVAMAIALLVAACHAGAQPLAKSPAPLAVCGIPARLQAALAAELAQGRAPEASPPGICVAQAARQGSIPAAMLLAGVYHQAIVAAGAGAGNPHALALDLFGRRVAWLHLAASQGDAPAQLLLAQAMDAPAYEAMPDMSLAWYQAAAEGGNRSAVAAIASAYTAGRIGDERLYDFRKWLDGQRNPAPVYRQAAALLGRPAALSLPR